MNGITRASVVITMAIILTLSLSLVGNPIMFILRAESASSNTSAISLGTPAAEAGTPVAEAGTPAGPSRNSFC